MTAAPHGLRFSANLSILFREHAFLERFGRAARAGFTAVEFWWPDGEDLDAVVAAATDADVEVVMMNFYAGDMAAGDRGLMSDERREHEFHANIPVALELAERVGCRQLNALIGGAHSGQRREDQLALARGNLRRAAAAARARRIDVLVEAVNTVDNDAGYLIARTDDAVAFVRDARAENVGLLHDLYHMQRMEGNLVETLRRHAGLIRHVHVADAPGRNEPGTGEINYRFVLDVIASLGYPGHVGLEYRPSTQATEDSLGWLDAFR